MMMADATSATPATFGTAGSCIEPAAGVMYIITTTRR